MSLTLLGWVLIAASIAISALLIFPRRSRREQLDLETIKARLGDIGARLKLGELSEAEADAARLALLQRPQSSSLGFNLDLRGATGTSIAVAACFVIVAGLGAVTSYVGGPAEQIGSGETSSEAPAPGSDGEVLANLTDYTRSIDGEQPAHKAAASTEATGKELPDVSTMIERLAARLQTEPNDLEGWRTLGWSYFHTARYEQAVAAFAKAVELDPSSDELKRSYEQAKAKASGGNNLETASTSEIDAVGKGHDGLSMANAATSDAAAAPERDAQIRSMVDGLANRLEASPRDVEGWTRLMRSRVVLGEKEVAETAFRKALEVFKDDSAASGQIAAAATELGLKAE